mgnify:CR=1 FL=1
MSPFNQAWTVLKDMRQTTLGEFHPDFPSPYGPVVASHGVSQLLGNKVNEEGINNPNPRGRNYFYTENDIHNPENQWLEGGYQEYGAADLSDKRTGFGIRQGFFQEGDMENMTHSDETGVNRVGAVDRPIPREFLTQMPTHPVLPIQHIKDNKEKYVENLVNNDNYIREYWGAPPKDSPEKLARYNNEIEQTRCEQLLLETNDLRGIITSFAYTHFNNKDLEKEAAKEVFTRAFQKNDAGKMQKFEHWLSSNDNSMFLLNNNVSIPDFNLFDILEFYIEFLKHYNLVDEKNDDKILSAAGYSKLNKFFIDFKNLPKMKKYFNSILYKLPYTNKSANFGSGSKGNSWNTNQIDETPFEVIID